MILQPLVENCIKHGLSRKVGGGTHHHLRASAATSGAIIEVEDDGLGMSDERLDTALSDGIGLSNVNERLRVIYGARMLAAADERRRPGHRRSRSRFPRWRRRGARQCLSALLRAVVVDDEQLAREELCYLLDEVGGVEVVAQAGNGLEALDAIGRHTPDLVFLDVQMPGLTGFEVARQLVDQEPPVDRHFRHRLRPARHRGVRGERGGLPAEAGRRRHGSKRAVAAGPAAGRRRKAR